MASIVCYDSNGNPLKHLTQWDSNQTITVVGVETSPLPTFHFFNRHSEQALVVSPSTSGNAVSVPVPNILLQQALPIIVCLYYEFNDGSSKTEYTLSIPVFPRPMPSDYKFEENIEYVSWKQLEEEARVLMEELRHSAVVVVGDTQPAYTNVLWFNTDYSTT